MAASCLSLCTVVLGTVLLTGVVLGVDKTVNNDATGADVVHAVIIKLSTCEKTNFNLSDHHLLRRIAYVETKDGVVKNNKERRLYGIWAVNDVTFLITNVSIKNISNVCGHLNSPGCSLSNLSFECARKPLYSGLIAKLYLRDYEQQIPTSDNITGQAMFWHNNYTGGGGGPEKFLNALRDNITLIEDCRINVDVFFVLDASNSIEDEDFRKVKNFSKEFVEEMTIGPNDDRVGIITYGSEAEIVFNLSNTTNKTDLLNAIEHITHKRGATNTVDALCKLQYGFNESRISTTVLRIAIVMTDGRSTVHDSNNICHQNTLEAAAAVHNLQPPVLVYAIGVSDNVNVEELEAIATTVNMTNFIPNFTSLQPLVDHYIDDICWKVSVNISNEEVVGGALDDSEVIHYVLTTPYLGVTIKICASEGTVQVYGSDTYSSPNSALNSFSLVLYCNNMKCNDEACKALYIPGSVFMHEKSKISTGQQVRSVEYQFSTENVMYISVKGASNKNNSFTMNMTEGDVPDDCVGEMVAKDCAKTYSSVIPHPAITNTPPPPTSRSISPDHRSKSKNLIMIATLSGSGFLLLVLSSILIVACVCGWSIYRRRKQRKMKGEDEYSLLDNEYTEM